MKYNDELVTLKGRCNHLTECKLLDFIDTLRDEGIIFNKLMKEVCANPLDEFELYNLESPSEFLTY